MMASKNKATTEQPTGPWRPGMDVRWNTAHEEADQKAAIDYCTVGHFNIEVRDDDEIEYVFVPKQPFTEPVWGKVVNKN